MLLVLVRKSLNQIAGKGDFTEYFDLVQNNLNLEVHIFYIENLDLL